jgi:alkanesulfonate monooxygenase SsuD/methylene tetrahydromethanopterin reductase-like flavin-dependent oxidoreductase (luciferase family)
MTVDYISNGRLVLGIGAGHAPLDHAMPGIPSWVPPERARRFKEFTEVTHQLLTTRKSSYQGQYYQVNDAVINPAPVQQPRPPLMLAAHGDTTLKLAARLTNSWNTFLKFNATPDEALALAQECNCKLDEFCTRTGREPSILRRSLLCGLTQDRLFASRKAYRDFIGRYREVEFDEVIFYWTTAEPQPVFPDWRNTTIPNRSTLDWVSEESASLKAASTGL